MRAYFERGRWRCRPQITSGVEGRLNLELNVRGATEAEREAAAQERAALIGELLKLLKAAGLDADLRERAARNLAKAKPADVATHEAVLRKAAGGVFARPDGELVTVQAFGERWTSGDLARQFPDQVRLRKCRNEDHRRLSRWLYPVVGQLPLRAVQLHHIETVAQNLAQASLRAVYRRAILSLVKRVLDLAVYPAKLIERNPFPARDFMPRETPRTLPMLRPSEDLQLMRCTRVQVKFRLFYGLLCRVGFRRSELRWLRWDAVDFEGGYVRFTAHKTAHKMGEKHVPLEASELRALRWWRGQQLADEPMVFPLLSCKLLLRHLKAAGVTREELFDTTDTRRCLSLHHLRGSFVTIKLAQGWPEARVMDCTGHLNLGTLTKYRRAGRLAERLGDWTPLDQAIPEISADTRSREICPQGVEKTGEEAGIPSPVLTCRPPDTPPPPPDFSGNPLTAPSANDVCGQLADTRLTPRCPAFFADCLPLPRAA